MNTNTHTHTHTHTHSLTVFTLYQWNDHNYQKRKERGLRWENLKERNCLEDLGVDGKITYQWIFKKYDERA